MKPNNWRNYIYEHFEGVDMKEMSDKEIRVVNELWEQMEFLEPEASTEKILQMVIDTASRIFQRQLDAGDISQALDFTE